MSVARNKGGRPRREDIDAAVNENPDVPARELARLIGCNHMAISRRREVSRHLSACESEFVATRPGRPVMRYHGGKWVLAPFIVAHLPLHRTYTEAFGGAASVLIRKPRSHAEVYNDLDREVVNLFEVLQSPVMAARLRRRLELTPYSRVVFVRAYEPSRDPVEQAVRTVVKSFMGFGSTSVTMESAKSAGAGFKSRDRYGTATTPTGFRAVSHSSGTTAATDWSNYPAHVHALVERLRGVVIENRDAVKVLQQHDTPATLHYVDPPYPHSTRSHHVITKRRGKGYRHEMTDAEHRALAEVLRGLEGMVVLSGYPCDLYDRELYPDWSRVERRALADGARERTEVLWLNPAAAAASPALQSAGAELPDLFATATPAAAGGAGA